MKHDNKGASLCNTYCILSVTSAGQNDLYWAKGSRPSFYSSAMLSVHLFVKHKFKSHKFCSSARNSQLSLNTCIPGRCNSASKGPVSSYTIPRRIWVIKHRCILYQPECTITWNKEIKSEVYFPDESNECFQGQQTYANILLSARALLVMSSSQSLRLPSLLSSFSPPTSLTCFTSFLLLHLPCSSKYRKLHLGSLEL